jgi:predicted dehydrogenase
VHDVLPERARTVAGRLAAESAPTWEACCQGDVDVVVVSTPNAPKDAIALGAVQRVRCVLVEKPAARSLLALRAVIDAADRGGALLKVGFNYRYFGGLHDAREALTAGSVGDLINYRIRHGHGGRPDYGSDWRMDRAVSGGGQLMDQGSHAIDLAHWYAGPVTAASCELQGAVWGGGTVEDNAFVTLRHGAVVGQIHVSWTQWQNLFAIELFGTRGAIVVEGLGGSYGRPRRTTYLRGDGGPPHRTRRYYGDDALTTLRREWEDVVTAFDRPAASRSAWQRQAIDATAVIDDLYRRSGARAGTHTGV